MIGYKGIGGHSDITARHTAQSNPNTHDRQQPPNIPSADEVKNPNKLKENAITKQNTENDRTPYTSIPGNKLPTDNPQSQQLTTSIRNTDNENVRTALC